MGDSQLVTAQIEKRKYRRVKLVTEVRCDAAGRDDILVTRDVSAGGMFVSTKTPLPIGSEVGLSFNLGKEASALQCAGKIVYSQQGMGMGIEFSGLNPECALALQKFVDESD